MGAVVTLTTDFGLADAYAGILKGVILRINPEADIVDICHTIPPQDIRQAAFILSTAYNYFPSQTVHLVVVDPGVGTSRRPIILKTPKAYFVAPDNGVLSYILDSHSSQPVADSQRANMGPDLKAYVITHSDYWLKPVSSTFHGRDIFAPVAARLSLGILPDSLGDNADTLSAFPISRPYRQNETLIGHVLHIDNFGNVITDIRGDSLSSTGQSVTIIIDSYSIRGLSDNYNRGESPIALFGSSGYLEIALKNASAAAFLKAGVGDEVRIKTVD